MNIENNKIIAAVVVACLVLAVISTLTDALYRPYIGEKRGYKIDVGEDAGSGGIESASAQLTVAQLLSAADANKGKKVASRCTSCHTLDKGGKNKVGPNLWGVVGHKMAHRDDFKYSSVLVNRGGTWDLESLFAFLHKPQKYMPGTKMSFAGIRKREQIADLIAYLNSLSDSPLKLPEGG